MMTYAFSFFYVSLDILYNTVTVFNTFSPKVKGWLFALAAMRFNFAPETKRFSTSHGEVSLLELGYDVQSGAWLQEDKRRG